MMIVVNKNGEVHVVEDPDSGKDNGKKVLDLKGGNKMCTNGERGMQSVEAHPNFEENRWIYLYYTKFKEGCDESPNTGPRNVLARYTMNAETLKLENEEILLEGAAMDERVHNGGQLVFGNDGKLWVTTGDAGVRDNAPMKRNLHGSLLRLNDDGSVPLDNPFAEDGTGVPCGQSKGKVPSDEPDEAVCSEIWAWGLRNPFRMALDTTVEETRLVISDVGAQHWEDVSWGGSDFRGVDYGWPKYEGPCKPGTEDKCDRPPEDSNVVMPFHFYQHTSTETGGCVAGTAFVPDGIFPPEYSLLMIDFVFLKIYNLIEDSSAECLDCSPPISGYRNETFYESPQEDGENVNEARMVDMFFGPFEDDLALYIIKFGNNDSILRIRYTGILNAPPLPAIEIQNPVTGSAAEQVQDGQVLVGNVVQFDGSTSSDPEGETLIYEWNFGDGDTSTVQSPSHVYNEAGEYRVTLMVIDEANQAQQASVTVVVGQPPKATIVSPADGSDFDVGQVLRLQGVAYDFEGNQIAEDQIIWEVRQHHADHYHPFLDETMGNDFDLYPAPEPEDFFAATNSFLKVIMRATDSNGLTTEVQRDVWPRTVTINIETDPEGLEVVVDDYAVLAPQEIVSWVNFNLPLHIRDQPPFLFKGWSDGSTSPSLNRTLLSNVENPVFRAKFCLQTNSFCGIASICCSGYCSDRGVCEDSPYTDPPIFLPPEDNVDDEFGDLSILPGVSDPLHDDDIEYQSSSNKDSDGGESGLGTSEKWLLSLLTIVVAMIPCCLGVWYCRRRRRSKDTQRSLDISEDEEPIVSTFITPAKESIAAAGAALSESASNFTSSIWDTLAEENERRAKLRAKLDNLTSEADPVIRTPETIADSPESTKTASSSSALSASIDDTLVRLDDILSRTFQFSRSRRSTPEKAVQAEGDISTKEVVVGSPDSDTTDVYLDTSSQLLIPLGDSIVPHSPLREDAAQSFAVEVNPYSFFSGGGLEDDLNGSTVHTADNASVHSESGLLLRHDPQVPTSLLYADDESSAADSEFFPAMNEDKSETGSHMQLRSLKSEFEKLLVDGDTSASDGDGDEIPLFRREVSTSSALSTPSTENEESIVLPSPYGAADEVSHVHQEVSMSSALPSPATGNTETEDDESAVLPSPFEADDEILLVHQDVSTSNVETENDESTVLPNPFDASSMQDESTVLPSPFDASNFDDNDDSSSSSSDRISDGGSSSDSELDHTSFHSADSGHSLV
ncbi:MAG: hypothetical protein SGILL_003784 [Bacillariaceae sp.]